MVSYRRAFTLIELLVVIVIILAVSVIALPTVLSGIKGREVGDAARLLQASLVGARDAAASAGSPRGLRFLPDTGIPPVYLTGGSNQLDPAHALVLDRWLQTEVPGDYATGLASVFPGTDYTAITAGIPYLVLEEQPGHWVQSAAGWSWQINEPTNWWWTIRAGERVMIRGQVLTVCGPLVQTPAAGTGNVELFTNVGDPGKPSPWSRIYTAPDSVTQATAQPQFLFLVNGRDDNGDGFIDNGWDGLDNNANGLTDEPLEWEAEAWPSSMAGKIEGAAYSIARRPVPSSSQQTVSLPASVVIDLTTWSTSGERSHLPVNPYTGQVDLIVESNGTVRPDLPYAVPSSLGMTSAFYHFWLADRSDIRDPSPVVGSYLNLPVPPVLAGSRYLVQVQGRTGRITTGELESFAVDPTVQAAPLAPFLPYRQGQ